MVQAEYHKSWSACQQIGNVWNSSHCGVNLSMKCLNVSLSPYFMYFRAVEVVGTIFQSANLAQNMVLKVSKQSTEYRGSV